MWQRNGWAWGIIPNITAPLFCFVSSLSVLVGNPCHFVLFQMPWAMAERERVVELFHQTGSATQARRTFMRNHRRGPTARTILGLVNRFRSTGGVARAARARGPSVSTQAAVPEIRRAVLRTPMISVRQLAKKADIDRCCVHPSSEIGFGCIHIR